MKLKQRVTEYTLYRYRYIIGYSFTAISIAALLVLSAIFVPQGIRVEEQISSLNSGALEFKSFNPDTVIDLPYHIMQRASFSLFGVSEITIKLPSIILGILSVLGTFLLIRAWARSNVAVIAVFIGTTIPALIFASQDGTPIIFSIMASTWLLLSATYVSRRKEPILLWKLTLFMFFVLTLYTPLGIYLCLALLSTVVIHPHIRYVVRRLNPNHLAISVAVAFVLLSPLLYSIATQPHTGLILLGIPDQLPELLAQAKLLAGALFGLQGSMNGLLYPVIPAGVGLLMLVGSYRLFKTRYTARSYVTWIWLLLLLPFIFLNPDYLLLTIPIINILVAMGMATLIIEWYRLFPVNPFARVFGLLPLGLIVAGVVLSSASRYFMGYISSPELVNVFQTDLKLLNSTLNLTEATKESPITVVVAKKDQDFYQLAANYNGRFNVTSSRPSQTPYIVVTGTGISPSEELIPSYIATTARKDKANRIYLYKSDPQ